VKDFMNAAQAPNLTAELVARGYNKQELQKIWGGNFLTLLRKAEWEKEAVLF
jgi:membrane dipeptidase